MVSATWTGVIRANMPGISPLLGTPLHEDCSGRVDVSWSGTIKSPRNRIPMLLSVNHHREAFCQVACPGISESTKHAKLRVLPVDSLKLPIVQFHQFLGRPQRFYDIAKNVSVSPMTTHCKTPSPPVWNATEWRPFGQGDAVWQGMSCDMTLSNAEEIVFPAATVQ